MFTGQNQRPWRLRACCARLHTLVAMLATVFPAWALADNLTPPDASVPAHAQAAQTENSQALPPVTVLGKPEGYGARTSDSATRTDTPLLAVPQSVQVITRALIEQQDRHTLSDALVNVSGITPTGAEAALFVQPIVRGFPAEIYLDGLPAYGTTASIDPASLVGTARIDVLKGPSSTVYGGGAGAPLGGLINVISERPTAKPGGDVALRTGSFSTANPAADLNLPLADHVAARIAGEYQKNNSWIDHVQDRSWSAQPSLAVQLSPQTQLLLRGQYNRRAQAEYSGLPAAQALAGQLDRNAFPGPLRGNP